MTYKEQIEKALATFNEWPKDQQDVYLRMLDDLKAKLLESQQAADGWAIRATSSGIRPYGLKDDTIVEVMGGGMVLVARADNVDWKHVQKWRETDQPVTKLADYDFCDGVCDD